MASFGYFPLAVADAAQLRARRQLAKLALYARFANVLAISVVGSVMWILYETWFRASALNQKWQVDWSPPSFWHVLSFLLLGAICVLWAPSDAATQFAYGEIAGKDDAPGALFDGFEGRDGGDWRRAAAGTRTRRMDANGRRERFRPGTWEGVRAWAWVRPR